MSVKFISLALLTLGNAVVIGMLLVGVARVSQLPRFSVRAMLIGMTLIALAIGLLAAVDGSGRLK
jgi:hypothetical protein